MLCWASNSGVTETGSGTTAEEAVVITIASIVARYSHSGACGVTRKAVERPKVHRRKCILEQALGCENAQRTGRICHWRKRQTRPSAAGGISPRWGGRNGQPHVINSVEAGRERFRGRCQTRRAPFQTAFQVVLCEERGHSMGWPWGAIGSGLPARPARTLHLRMVRTGHSASTMMRKAPEVLISKPRCDVLRRPSTSRSMDRSRMCSRIRSCALPTAT